MVYQSANESSSLRTLVQMLWLSGMRSMLVLLCLSACTISLQAGLFDDLDRSSDTEYLVRLSNGEILLGSVVDVVEDKTEGMALKLKTAIGVAKIFEWQVLEIVLVDDAYRQSNRVFFLPTAEPISKNHYVGNTELFVWTAGIGFWDYVSVNMMRSTLPWIESRYQFSQLNVKASIYRQEYETMKGHMNLAAGGVLTWLNAGNRLSDLYLSATYTRVRSRLTAMVFMNMSSGSMTNGLDGFPVYAGNFGSVIVNYPAGAVGFALGLDTRLPGRQDLHVIAELWNGNLSSANNTAFLLGLRFANSSISMDFGMLALTTPTVIPVTSFSWTPF